MAHNQKFRDFKSLSHFIKHLESNNDLIRIKHKISTSLEITEITDRISKSEGGGKVILFENTGYEMPVVTNIMGSEKRMHQILRTNEPHRLFDNIFNGLSASQQQKQPVLKKISGLFSLVKLFRYKPKQISRKGKCQYFIYKQPDLLKLPVLKCWPYDGGKFITLPVVITRDPVSHSPNAGMYRMQILDKTSTAMHWHFHKTGASHFRKYKKLNKKMPVAVALGGDPLLTYCATAPLPEGFDEFFMAGIIRKRAVKMAKCITNDLLVPDEADIIIEGFIDPDEPFVVEGPFGDHTGFYSLQDFYPVFHVTCITTCKKPVYPATIVGIPPQEDAYITLATEKLFLLPLKQTICPEIIDLHMPVPGVAHNLVVVSIQNEYNGQVHKTAHALWGAGQLMFNKILVVTTLETSDYSLLCSRLFFNCSFPVHLYFGYGPLDILDHSSPLQAMGSKLCIDLTNDKPVFQIDETVMLNAENICARFMEVFHDFEFYNFLSINKIPMLVVTSDEILTDKDKQVICQYAHLPWRIILFTDKGLQVYRYDLLLWYVLANIDPSNDIEIINKGNTLLVNALSKSSKPLSNRPWPNPVIMNKETIEKIDNYWNDLNIGPFRTSPSLAVLDVVRNEGPVRKN